MNVFNSILLAAAVSIVAILSGCSATTVGGSSSGSDGIVVGSNRVITSVTPSYMTHNASCSITVSGDNFQNGDVIYIGSTYLTTIYQNSTALTTTIPAADIPSTGSYTITVHGDGNTTSGYTIHAT